MPDIDKIINLQLIKSIDNAFLYWKFPASPKNDNFSAFKS